MVGRLFGAVNAAIVDAVDATAISGSVLRQLIGDAGIRIAAEDVRDEIAAMPEPAAVVPQLASLARG